MVYGASDLSDGTIRFIVLAILFLQPGLSQTIIIDEPELGLYLAAIAKLAGLIPGPFFQDEAHRYSPLFSLFFSYPLFQKSPICKPYNSGE